MYNFHIADDHPLFRNAILGVIKSNYPDSVVSQSISLESTIQELEKNDETDLLLLDLHMPGCKDLFGLIMVREKFPSIPVAIISAVEEPNTISRAMGHGACGYIPKSCSPQKIQSAIQSMLEGNHWVPDEFTHTLTPVANEERDLAAKIATLTPQQYRVLCLLREGWLNKQIGFEMGVTEATVKAHITAIFRKLGISNRTQAVIMMKDF
ncbi:response regulator transcription factor [Teredinibacter turnerae]|uniref:Regulator in two-component regulatory system n=1 Tax=Teredinibacter turnerae (strain ATCC 39867 / T7901) TaxID=377629 RepID=C5BJQ2_TERTT|nr:response regulator transcription factor [Teredinibacter turnerae]ACR13507.1 regulator in two-component regulatory system [Teredinibacter turnerae T7901]